MQAKTVAQKLKARGINVIDYVEGDDWEDGMVRITELVHVQVPTYGRGANVVQECDEETFLFKPRRMSLDALIKDIRAALGIHA